MRYSRYSNEPKKPRENAEVFWANKETVCVEHEAGRDDVATIAIEIEAPVEEEKIVEC
jgi:hypothetical protein